MNTPRYAANLPSVGLATFLRSPACEDFSKIAADVAVLGIPYDGGSGYRPGTRFGPREIRNFSTRYAGWGGPVPAGFWDINRQTRFLAGVTMVDCGDVDITYYDFEKNRSKITSSVEAILDQGAFPVLIGGDHSVTFPNVCAFERYGPLDIIHIDAHLDWIDEIDGIRYASGSPLRRIRELPFIRNMAHIGIRDIRSREGDYHDATVSGSKIVTRRDVREQGVPAILKMLPPLGNTYITIDIDGLDPSIAPGVGSPTVDGLLYHEVIDLLRGVIQRSNVVGFDLVEVNPTIDQQGQTCLLATTLIMEVLGDIFAAKKQTTDQ